MKIDPLFLKQLDRFSIILKKKVTSSFVGERESPFMGCGLIFSEYSNYRPGDDFKHIDWRAYARTNRLFVKRFEENRELAVHVLVDFSSSMNFGSHVKKYEFASQLGLGFCYIALKNNEKFVLSTFDTSLDFYRPSKGQRQLGAVIDFLGSKKAQGKTAFGDALSRYKSLITQKSLVVIISDFFYPLEEIREVLYHLRRHSVIFVQVLDGVERKMNLSGDYHLVDLESGESLRTYIDPYLKKQYFERLERHNAEVQDACSAVGAQFYSVGSDENIFDIFYTILT